MNAIGAVLLQGKWKVSHALEMFMYLWYDLVLMLKMNMNAWIFPYAYVSALIWLYMLLPFDAMIRCMIRVRDEWCRVVC